MNINYIYYSQKEMRTNQEILLYEFICYSVTQIFQTLLSHNYYSKILIINYGNNDKNITAMS